MTPKQAYRSHRIELACISTEEGPRGRIGWIPRSWIHWSNGDPPELIELIDDLKGTKQEADATALRRAKARIDEVHAVPNEQPLDTTNARGQIENVVDEFLRVCDRDELLRELAGLFPALSLSTVDAKQVTREEVEVLQVLERLVVETMVRTARRFGSFLEDRLSDLVGRQVGGSLHRHSPRDGPNLVSKSKNAGEDPRPA